LAALWSQSVAAAFSEIFDAQQFSAIAAIRSSDICSEQPPRSLLINERWHDNMSCARCHGNAALPYELYQQSDAQCLLFVKIK